ncbi:MAG: (E)-4-hydroxy-3-methylbut-2-enyl-diphosphate synthase [Bacteroidales bacterium]|nr:(E)-4-hydroxy-3-methylbut-2-enyl-diphosphate synthase [Bacteroidales bacterium]
MNSKRQFQIGNLPIGGNAPVVVQSMTNTDTADVQASVAQCKRMIDAGAQMVRLTVPSLKEVEPLKEIQKQLKSDGYGNIPLVADVHFNPKVAEAVATFMNKVRVNPGNFTDKRNFSRLDLSDSEYAAQVERMALRAKPLFEICKQHDTAVRIGINHGSLCDRIVSRYGNTPEAMVQSAIEWLEICEQYDFHKVVLSMKSSNVLTMMTATKLLHDSMLQRNMSYPLHLGVTEAGNDREGRVKSAAGIGALLLMGIGDTIRVSLTEPPENESPFGHKLVKSIENLDVEKLRIQDGTLVFEEDEADVERWMCRAAAAAGYAHFQHRLREVQLRNPHFSDAQNTDLANLVMQACRIKILNTEFVACPSCGRTQYDIQSVFSAVKQRFAGYPGLKIGVMGCIVNGPGEMADADYGIVGASNGLVCVYEGKKRVSEPMLPEQAMDVLEKLIMNHEL